jgi:hypothetical protein
MTTIYEYSLSQAVEDGTLVEIFKNRWDKLSGGKPILVTRHLYTEISLAALLEIWNQYVEWRDQVMPTLPEEDQLFSTTMNGEKIWVLEDDSAYTILYPVDY